MFLTTRARNFDGIEHLTSRQWIESGSGKSVYDKLWKRLQDLEFYEYADRVSASWIATIIKRIGNSRKSIFQEQLGYVDGGSETLVEAVADDIRRKGGRIHLKTLAERVVVDSGRVTAVLAGGRQYQADAVICTVPIPLVNNLVPDLPQSWKDKYDAIRNIGVVCLLFKLRKSVTPYFWLNIIADDIEIPGIIEFSNLRPVSDTIVYVPYSCRSPNPNGSGRINSSSMRLSAISSASIRNPRRRRARRQGWPAASRPAYLRAELSRQAAAGSDANPRPSDRGYLLLLSRGSRSCGKHSIGAAHGGTGKNGCAIEAWPRAVDPAGLDLLYGPGNDPAVSVDRAFQRSG